MKADQCPLDLALPERSGLVIAIVRRLLYVRQSTVRQS